MMQRATYLWSSELSKFPVSVKFYGAIAIIIKVRINSYFTKIYPPDADKLHKTSHSYINHQCKQPATLPYRQVVSDVLTVFLK